MAEDGVDENWNSFVKERGRKKKSKLNNSKDDDEAMFQFGRVIGDDEDDQVEARAASNEKRTSEASGHYIELASPSYIVSLIVVVDDQA